MNHAKQQQAIDASSVAELRQIARLAIGRLIGMMSRPCRPGDIEAYEELRVLVYAVSERLDKADGEE